VEKYTSVWEICENKKELSEILGGKWKPQNHKRHPKCVKEAILWYGRERGESRKQKAESRKQKAESRKQKAESRKQKAESRKQKAESRRKGREGSFYLN
jgi:hypothetical protein